MAKKEDRTRPRGRGSTRDILGLWAGDGWRRCQVLGVLTERRNGGVADACMVVCDGLRGLPDAIAEVWLRAVGHAERLTCRARSAASRGYTVAGRHRHSDHLRV